MLCKINVALREILDPRVTLYSHRREKGLITCLIYRGERPLAEILLEITKTHVSAPVFSIFNAIRNLWVNDVDLFLISVSFVRNPQKIHVRREFFFL